VNVDIHELHAELEACRRDIATARHSLEFAHPDAVVAWRERLEHAEAREQELVRQLSET
jgi:hypothetical protein